MSDKKHIDRLFQESFKDFEATPSDAVWKNIEAKLNEKKKKRRVIPIWWRYAGVAALLLLLLTIGINSFNNVEDSPQTNQIVDTEDSTSTKQNDAMNKTDDVISDDYLNQVDAVIADNNSEENTIQESTESQNSHNTLKNKIAVSEETSIAEASSSKNRTTESGGDIINSSSFKNTHSPSSELKNNTSIASNTEEKEENNNSELPLFDKKEAGNILNNTLKNKSEITQNNISEEEKKATNDITNNTLSIEEEINKAKDIIEEKKNSNRWSVAPNAAPVYFNTLGEGSSIDPQFVNNSKSGELNMSYGISASYAINKKLSVRSGINKVNLGYNTNNVVVFQSVGVSRSSAALQNVETATGTDNSTLDALTGSRSNTESTSVISVEALSAQGSTIESFTSPNASINQALGYIEIPLEFQYALSNKRLGVNVIGGFSSFFLNDNEIYSEDINGIRTFLGEANNINKVSYSANFGLGLNYQITKKLDLNLEPMFKYQINTFNNTSGDFQPFFIGIYTGFAIKF